MTEVNRFKGAKKTICNGINQERGTVGSIPSLQSHRDGESKPIERKTWASWGERKGANLGYRKGKGQAVGGGGKF